MKNLLIEVDVERGSVTMSKSDFDLLIDELKETKRQVAVLRAGIAMDQMGYRPPRFAWRDMLITRILPEDL